MICFDVYVNGNRICRAGVGSAGVLTAIIDWVGGAPESPRSGGRTTQGEVRLHVGGLYSPDDETDIHPKWTGQHLHSGDVITVKVVEADQADKPSEEKVNRHALIEHEQRKYYLAMKKKFEPAGSSARNSKSSKTGKNVPSPSGRPSKTGTSSRNKKK